MMRHVVLPAAAPIALVGLYFTPLSVLGCATRGWLALVVVVASVAGAFVAIGLAFRHQRHGGTGGGGSSPRPS